MEPGIEFGWSNQGQVSPHSAVCFLQTLAVDSFWKPDPQPFHSCSVSLALSTEVLRVLLLDQKHHLGAS